MGDDRPNVYLDDTTNMWVYRASSLGNCVKGLVAARLQYEAFPFPDWLLEKFEQGNAAEPMLIKRFLDYQHGNDTWVMLDPETESSYVNRDHTFYPHVKYGGSHDGQFTCEVPVGTTAVIRGHMDGIAESNAGERVVVECKAFAQSYWDKYQKGGIEAFPYYATQLSLYMHATGLPGLFVVGLKDENGLITDTTELIVDRFEKPILPLGKLKARVAQIEKIAASGELPACDQNQYPCQYVYLHDDDEDDNTEVTVDPDLDVLAEKYSKGMELEKEGKRIKEEAKIGIQAIFDMTSIGGGKISTSTWEVVDYVDQRKERTEDYKASTVRYPKIKRKGA
jgi:hypothetical protein